MFPLLDYELRQYNKSLAHAVESKWGITLKTYKVLKAATQLTGAASGIYAMSLGADPMVAFSLIAVIISGPEAFEYLLTHQEQ